ncbi:MAG: hypothetical protein ACLU9V_00645 [Roseburia sp.]
MKFQKFMYIVGVGNAGKSKTPNYINQIMGSGKRFNILNPRAWGKRFPE